jgi:hypoxanthine phosphoribosyltransferase
MEFKVLTWNRVYSDLLRLWRKIVRSGFVPDVIVGVCRGGWVPARVLSDLLNPALLGSIGIEFYTHVGETKRRPTLTQPLSVKVSGKKVLLVDEVVDSGKSLKLAKEKVLKEGSKEVRTVAMFVKPWSTIQPDYEGEKTSCWIVFPWEVRETLRSMVIEPKSENRRELNDLKRGRLSGKQAQRLLNKILRGKHQSH